MTMCKLKYLIVIMIVALAGCDNRQEMTTGSKQKSDQDMKECAFSSEQKYGVNISGASDFKSNLAVGVNYEEAFKSSVLHDQSISTEIKKMIVENYYECLKKK